MKTDLTHVLRTTLALAVTAQYTHWNAMAPSFLTWHRFMGDIYADCSAAADTLAEAMRTQQWVVPFAYPESVPTGTDQAALLARVARANLDVVAALTTAIPATSSVPDIQNLLQDRLATHQRWAWMFRASEVSAR